MVGVTTGVILGATTGETLGALATLIMAEFTQTTAGILM